MSKQSHRAENLRDATGLAPARRAADDICYRRLELYNLKALQIASYSKLSAQFVSYLYCYIYIIWPIIDLHQGVDFWISLPLNSLAKNATDLILGCGQVDKAACFRNDCETSGGEFHYGQGVIHQLSKAAEMMIGEKRV